MEVFLVDLEQFNKKKSINLNSIWKKLERTGFKFYCVSCHKERHIEVPARAGSFQFYFHAGVTTAFMMLITWPIFHWKGVVLLVPVLGIFEGLYRMKMRSVLVCPDCDFDPILYMVDPDKAAQQVENVWRKKFEEKGYPFPERKFKNGKRIPPKAQPQTQANPTVSDAVVAAPAPAARSPAVVATEASPAPEQTP